jgi:large subunit ribosomal protein L17
MRHGRKINHLSRKSAHRKAMLQNMATSLILHKRIHTTLAKAKALRTYIEPLLTKSKEDTTHSRRIVFSELQSKEAVTELFREVSVKIAERPGGYTRIIKIGNRLGDNAELCMMELVDFNENLLGDKQSKTKAARKRRGTGKKKTEEIAAVTPSVAKTTEEVTEVVEEKVEAAEEAVPEVIAETENPVEDQTTEETPEEHK